MRSHPGSFVLALAIAGALAACSRSETTAPATAAKPPAAAAPTVVSDEAHLFTIGTFQATALRDGVLEFPNDNQVFGIGHTPAEVAAVLGAADLPTDKVQLSVQPLLVRAGGQVLLFDTGAGGNFGPTAGKLLTSLAAAGIAPAGVTDIFISHAHGDHVGGLVDATGGLVFPNATIYMSAPEWDYIRKLDEKKAAAIGLAQIATFITAVTPKVVAFTPGTDMLPGVVKAVEIKGHTPGHSAYLIGSGTDTLLYIGDAAHHSIISVQKPEWPIGFDGDAVVGAASRAAMLEENSTSGQRIYGVHFPYPGLGKFLKRAEGYVWVAE